VQGEEMGAVETKRASAARNIFVHLLLGVYIVAFVFVFVFVIYHSSIPNFPAENPYLETCTCSHFSRDKTIV
jgi:hypothetical protein